MEKIKIGSIVFVAMLFSLMISSQNLSVAISVKSVSDDDAIFILGNAGFNASNGVRSGTGTLADPYIISGWNLTTVAIFDSNCHFRLINCRIDGSATNFGLIRVENGSIENCHFLNMIGGIGLSKCKNITIKDNTFSNITYLAISFDESENLIIEGNQFSSVGRAIGDGPVEDNGSSGNISIIDNLIDQGFDSIVLYSCSGYAIVDNNTINCRTGIQFKDAQQGNTRCIITHNRIKHIGVHGEIYDDIGIRPSIFTQYSEVSNNTIDGFLSGILSSSGSRIISNNKITNSSNFGLELYLRDDNINIFHNEILNSSNGLMAEGTLFLGEGQLIKNATIEDNSFKLCDRAAIRILYCNGFIIDKNKIAESEIGISIEGSKNLTVSNNTITDSRYAIQASDSANFSITGNAIRNSSQCAIFFDNCVKGTVEKNVLTNNTLEAYDNNHNANKWDLGLFSFVSPDDYKIAIVVILIILAIVLIVLVALKRQKKRIMEEIEFKEEESARDKEDEDKK